jgi:hypothetical protein
MSIDNVQIIETDTPKLGSLGRDAKKERLGPLIGERVRGVGF